MRARNIKPGFFKCEMLAECLIESRLLYMGLVCLSRKNRVIYDLNYIKRKILPNYDFNIEDLIKELIENELIEIITTDSVYFLFIKNQEKHFSPERKYKYYKQEVRKYGRTWAAIRQFVLDYDDYICQYCGSSGEKLEVDHILPISRGGDNGTENLITSCMSCNRSKGNKTLSEWLS